VDQFETSQKISKQHTWKVRHQGITENVFGALYGSLIRDWVALGALYGSLIRDWVALGAL
jgi:hypothetical protein